MRALELHGLRAEYLVESAGDDVGTDTLESGAFVCVTTDRVRFLPIGAGQARAHATGGGYRNVGEDAPEHRPVPLEAVPPLALSEILRDVDLFAGVASIVG